MLTCTRWGMLQLNLNEIVEKVAFYSLCQEGLLEPSWRRPRHLPPRPAPSLMRLVQGRIATVKHGS